MTITGLVHGRLLQPEWNCPLTGRIRRSRNRHDRKSGSQPRIKVYNFHSRSICILENRHLFFGLSSFENRRIFGWPFPLHLPPMKICAGVIRMHGRDVQPMGIPSHLSPDQRNECEYKYTNFENYLTIEALWQTELLMFHATQHFVLNKIQRRYIISCMVGIQ